MLARLVVVLVLIPVAIILIALTVANRDIVAFTLDPFNPGSQALTFHAPLFVFLYLALLTGLVLGGLATWFTQRKYRKRARNYSRQVTALSKSDNGRTTATPKSASPALPAPGV